MVPSRVRPRGWVSTAISLLSMVLHVRNGLRHICQERCQAKQIHLCRLSLLAPSLISEEVAGIDGASA